jgi:hypothetical protein
MRGLQPTEKMRDYEWARNTYANAHPGATPDEIAQGAQGIMLGMGGMGGGDSATRSWQMEKINWNRDHPGEPYPWGEDTPLSFSTWKTKQDELTKDQQEASNKRPQYTQNLTDLRNHLTNIIGLKAGGDPNNPDDYDQAKLDMLKSALSKPGAQTYLSGDPKDLTTQALGAALSPEEKAVLDEIRDTTDPKQLFGSLGARAPKRGVSDVTEIGSGLTSMQNIRKGFDRYLDGVKSTITATDTATANAYGASAAAEDAPDYTKPYIDESYLSGGSMYPFSKKPTPMTADQIAQGQARIKANPNDKAKIIKIIRANNFDPKPLL